MLQTYSHAAMSRTTSTRFGSGGGSLSAQRPLSNDEIARVAPSVFAPERHSSRSDRYTYIPTVEVLNGLRAEGFLPYAVKQGGSRDQEKRGFTKHMIRLRQESAPAMRVVGDSVPEVVLLNSHDGTSSYQLMFGWFRLVCLNGLILPDTTRGGIGIKVPHKGDIVRQVIEGAFTVIDEGRSQVHRIETMQQVRLEAPESLAFARAAAELRFEGASPVEPVKLLHPRRSEDQGNDLWRTFNRVQENVMRGGVGYVQQNQAGQRSHRHTRPVNGVEQDVKLNRALFVLAEEMAKLKAA